MNSITIKGTISKQNKSSNKKELKLQYSYNPNITPGLNKKEAAEKSRGWILESVKWEETALTKMVREICYIPSTLSDGHKVKESVSEVHFLPLDFDKGEPTLAEFIENGSKWKFSWFMHTTVSHQKEKISKEGEILAPIDRFRVIIPFSKPLSRDELMAQKEFWMEKFSKLDTGSFQGERYYYQTPSAETHLYSYKDKEGNIIWLDPDNEEIKKWNKEKSNIKKTKHKNDDEGFDLDDVTCTPFSRHKKNSILEKTKEEECLQSKGENITVPNLRRQP